ncbi:MAG: electron transport complex subunit E [Lachnospiraceae bacterium]|nr:electron transport complex subunit E [Lachnospiraceae bacterium]
MNKIGERLFNGIIKENPTLVLMLGMCPTLAVTTSAINGLGMGLTTTVVLALSNAIISLLRKIIPDKVRIPAFIVIIASFVTVVELLLEGFIPSLYSALGLYIPLIVVNCIILGRAESYAYKNPVIPSFFDGVGMGLGFTCSLTIIGLIREIIGAGEAFGFHFMPESYVPVSIFVMAPGAFFVLAILVAIQNKVKMEGEKKGRDMSRIGSGCSEDCMNCGESGCSARKFYDNSDKQETKAENQEESKAETEGKENEQVEAETDEKNEIDSKAETEEVSADE